MKDTDLPTGDEKRAMVKSMFDDIAPTYEKANRFISFGLDNFARRAAMKELRLAPGSTVIDLASGTGDFSRLLTQAGMTSLACDFSLGMLVHAHDINNRIQCDGMKLPFANESVDGVVCGYALRNFVDLDILFPELMRVMRPGGRFAAVDVSKPTNPLLRAGNKLWFGNVAPKLGWLISKNKRAYEYLPRSTAYLASADTLSSMLDSAGAENSRVVPLIGGSLLLISATKALS